MMRFSGFILPVLSLLSSCVAQNLVEVASGAENLSTLVLAIQTAELEDTLNSANFTVFAPDNDAFSAVNQTLLDKLLTPQWQLHLTNLLTYHVTPGSLDATAVVAAEGGFLTMVNQETVDVTSDNGVRINDATVTSPDIPADNGIAHIIDSVLLPNFLSQTIVDIAIANLDTLTELVLLADLGDILATTDGLTVFAPTNEAFAALPEATLEFLKSADGKDTLVNILQYHVVVGVIPSTNITEGPFTFDSFVASLQGEELAVTKSDDGAVSVDGASVVNADILASNGIVHVIDAVLLPDTLYDVVFVSDGLNSLDAAVVQAGLDDVLSGFGPYTLFAPSNGAFEAINTVVAKLLTDPWKKHLEEVLLYHTAPGSLDSAAVAGLTALTMANGEDVNITIDGGDVRINDQATVTVVDGRAINGIYHVIDSVLLPSFFSQTIVDIAIANLATLAELVVTADLADILSTTDGLTVFAPTDAAFAALPEETLEFLKSEDGKDTLVEILQHHVVQDVIPSTNITEGSTSVTSLEGGDLVVTKSADGAVAVDGASVVDADILASNGIVHVIDKVILPNNLVDVVAATDILSSLAAAVVQAGLDGVLSTFGPYTVFAPSNDAFEAINTVVDKLLTDPWKKHLEEVLLYHTASGSLDSAAVAGLTSLTMVNEEDVAITIGGNNVLVNEATVTGADIRAINGIAHVIDSVLLPSFLSQTIVDIASANLANLTGLVVAANISDYLSTTDGLTVFAPTDAAIAAIPADRLEFLMSPEGKEELVALLQYHVVESVIPSAAIAEGSTTVDTVQGGKITVTKSSDGKITVDDATVVNADILASNGIVHVIDTVLTVSEDTNETMETTSSAVSICAQMGASLFISMWAVVAML